MSKRLDCDSVRKMGVIDFLVKRHAHDFELIEPQSVNKPVLKVKRHIVLEKLDNVPVKYAAMAGMSAYSLICSAIMLKQSRHKAFTFANAVAASALPAGIFGLTAYLKEKIDFHEMKNKKYNEYITRFIEVESTLSESISSDTRLTRGAMLYRRDLRDAILSLGEALGYDRTCADVCCFEYSSKSKVQILSVICAEFGKINAEFLTVLEHSKIDSIGSDTIIITLDSEEDLNIIKAASNRIYEVFAVFGFKPIYMPKNYYKSILE